MANGAVRVRDPVDLAVLVDGRLSAGARLRSGAPVLVVLLQEGLPSAQSILSAAQGTWDAIFKPVRSNAKRPALPSTIHIGRGSIRNLHACLNLAEELQDSELHPEANSKATGQALHEMVQWNGGRITRSDPPRSPSD